MLHTSLWNGKQGQKYFSFLILASYQTHEIIFCNFFLSSVFYLSSNFFVSLSILSLLFLSRQFFVLFCLFSLEPLNSLILFQTISLSKIVFFHDVHFYQILLGFWEPADLHSGVFIEIVKYFFVNVSVICNTIFFNILKPTVTDELCK